MDENSTQLQQRVINRKPKQDDNAGPRRSTIDIIRQFARTYTCDSRLHPSLCEFMAN